MIHASQPITWPTDTTGSCGPEITCGPEHLFNTNLEQQLGFEENVVLEGHVKKLHHDHPVVAATRQSLWNVGSTQRSFGQVVQEW